MEIDILSIQPHAIDLFILIHLPIPLLFSAYLFDLQKVPTKNIKETI